MYQLPFGWWLVKATLNKNLVPAFFELALAGLFMASFFNSLALSNHHPQPSRFFREERRHKMSRFKLVVGAVALAVSMSLLGVFTPTMAMADEPWSPTPPVAQDRCGTAEDKFYLYEENNTLALNEEGQYLPQGTWLSTNGAASIVVILRSFSGDEEPVRHTLTFDVRPDSSCVEAPDTVTTRIVQCVPMKNADGTHVEFTHTNIDDDSDLQHTDPVITAMRWDKQESAYIKMRRNPAAVWPESAEPEIVQDGESFSMTGGGSGPDTGLPNSFLLVPGTYILSLTTKETGTRVLPNRLFVPACGDSKPPKGDPMGGTGPITGPGGTKHHQPKVVLGRCRAHKVAGLLDSRKATRATRYNVMVDPRKGKTKRMAFTVAAGKSKRLVLRKQKTGTKVKVVFAGKTVTRRLKC